MLLRDIQLAEASLSSLFEMNETSGDLVDSKGSVVGSASSGFSAGALVGGQDPIAYDDPGSSIFFDNSFPGSINFGDVFDIGTPNPSWAFEFTIRFPTAPYPYGSNQYIFGKGFPGAGGGYWCDTYFHTSKAVLDGFAIRFRRWATGGGAGAEIYTASTFRPGERNHVVITHNSSIDTIYCMINGYIVTQASGVMTQPVTTENFILGAFQNSTSGGAGQGLEADVSNFAYYNNYLSEHRMREHYRAFLNPRKRIPMIHVGRDHYVDDFMRAEGYAGDRRTAEGSYGAWYERSNVLASAGKQTNAETSTAGWSGVGATITRDTTEFAFAGTSYKVDCNGSAAGEGLDSGAFDISLHGASGQQQVFSCWVKAPNGATLRLALDERTLALALIGTTTQDFVGTGDWQEVEVTRDFGATGDGASVRVETRGSAQNIDFYVGGLQFEYTGNPFAAPGRGWKSPYMGSHFSAAGGRGVTRLLLYDADMPLRFWQDQGWMAFRWRHGFTSKSFSDGENQGFAQRGDATNRISIFSNAVSAFFCYSGSSGGDASAYQEVPGWTGSDPTQMQKGSVYTAGSRWGQNLIGAFFDATGWSNNPPRPPSNPASNGLEFADIYGGYQWFGMRPQSEVFWMICGSGIPDDADGDAMYALSNTPTVAQVKAAFATSVSAVPYAFYQSGNLFLDLLGRETSYHRRRVSVR